MNTDRIQNDNMTDINLLDVACARCRSRKKMLTHNWKMRETELANPGTRFLNFNMPALKTCPMAGKCKEFCYATQGHYVFPAVKACQEWHYELTKLDSFVDLMDDEVKWNQKNCIKRKKQLYVRIHDSGDFYSIGYARKWIEIANRNPDVVFYAYTKCVSMFHQLEDNGELPKNFHTVKSEGGKEDDLIRDTDVKAIVVNDVSEITGEMKDATGNDMIAMSAKIVALPYHGSRKWNND